MFLLLMKKKKTVRFQDIICITNKFYIIIIVQFLPSLINLIFVLTRANSYYFVSIRINP